MKELPTQAGVYFHKDRHGEIIYVGKAANLRNRVRQYFQKSRLRDPKTDLLIADIADTDWMRTDSEIEALFLEAEMIRRYMPRYNILLRDDKSMVYIRIDYASDYPTVGTTRRPLDDGARYFGPYLSAGSVRQALKVLRRIFPFATKQVSGQKRANLHYHLGLDPGLEEGKTSLNEYRANLRKLIAVMEGRRVKIEKELERDMKKFAKTSQFEQAAKARNQLFALRNLGKQVIFSDKEFLDISKDHALIELAELLGLYEDSDPPQETQADRAQGVDEERTEPYKKGTVKGVPQSTTPRSAASSDGVASSTGQQARTLRLLRRIEGYDISHMSGTDVVASMVVFTNGVSDKSEYRKFKTTRNQNNDFANMHETIKRRLSETNRQKWGLPNLVLIDGGKGQLDAAIAARDTAGCQQLPFIGLAKREEQIVIKKDASHAYLNETSLHKLGGFASESADFILVNLPHHTNLVKLLQRVRDESHRFAVSYHSVLKVKRQTASALDDIPGIGPATRKRLLKTFGSVKTISESNEADLASAIGSAKAKLVHRYLAPRT